MIIKEKKLLEIIIIRIRYEYLKHYNCVQIIR